MRVGIKKILGACAVSMLACAVGCGGGSNNDQGMAFSLIGFNTTDDEGVCENDTFLTAIRYPISEGSGQETVGDVGAFSCLTLQNNMNKQFVRVDRVLIDYFIAGAAEQPPSTTSAFAQILGPVAVQGGTGPTSSLPPGFAAGNEVTGGFAVVPPEISQWIALNRQNLPEPPFQMFATVRGSGVTSGGDRIESNPADLLVVVVPDNLITPTGGTGLTGGAETGNTDGGQVPQ